MRKAASPAGGAISTVSRCSSSVGPENQAAGAARRVTPPPSSAESGIACVPVIPVSAATAS